MGRAEAALACRLLDKAAAVVAARPQFGPGRIDLDARAVLVELERKEAARIGRKRHRVTAHELGQDLGDVLRVARGDGQMMDHGFLSIFPTSIFTGYE